MTRVLPAQIQSRQAVHSKAEPTSLLILFYVILGVALFAFVQKFSLLSPILLVLLICLAVNPMISQMRALTEGRKIPTGLAEVMALMGWSLFRLRSALKSPGKTEGQSNRKPCLESSPHPYLLKNQLSSVPFERDVSGSDRPFRGSGF